MSKKEVGIYAKHSAGATVTHEGEFSSISAYSNDFDMTQEFRGKWVIPFYMNLNENSNLWIDKIISIYSEITDEIILTNLGEFNWRTRSTGAFFSSIKCKKEFTKIIGEHLLKSEVCFSGSEYAVTLAYFNTKESIGYLNQYLEYYLKKPELYFDQGAVISALKFLDEKNGTNLHSKHVDNWNSMLDSRKVLEKRNHEVLLKSPDIPEESREVLTEIEFNDEVNYKIKLEYVTNKIEVINKIHSNIPE